MKKKTLIIILLPIALVTIVLIMLGIVFDKEEFEKRQGRTHFYDVSSDGAIAYVYYDEGHAGIYLSNSSVNPRQPLMQLNLDQEILDVSFSPDGKKLAYIISHKDKRAELKSAIHVIDLETNFDRELVAEETLITEVEYHPTSQDILYYLKAETFKNYSPIASARPHDYDVFSYQISSDQTQQHTQLKKYMMNSLRVSNTERAVYLEMGDDADAETAEDIFASHQRIFKIALDNPDSYHVVSQKDRDVDIFDFTLTSDDQAFIFQSISNSGEGGIFQYELYYYNRETKQEKQLTHIREHTSNPIMDPNGETVYFIVDRQFGQQVSDYHLYKVNIDGSNQEEVILYMQ